MVNEHAERATTAATQAVQAFVEPFITSKTSVSQDVSGLDGFFQN